MPTLRDILRASVIIATALVGPATSGCDSSTGPCMQSREPCDANDECCPGLACTRLYVAENVFEDVCLESPFAP